MVSGRRPAGVTADARVRRLLGGQPFFQAWRGVSLALLLLFLVSSLLAHGSGLAATHPWLGPLGAVALGSGVALLGLALLLLWARWGTLADPFFRSLTGSAGATVLGIFCIVIVVLAYTSWPSLTEFGWSFLWTQTWNPNPDLPPVRFGALPFVYGTLVTSAIAMALGIPVSLGIAVFLTELAPTWLRGGLSFVIELLAAVPSVVYGLWGLFVLVPIMRSSVEPGLFATVGNLPVLGELFTPGPFGILGLDKLTAGVILAIMIIPTISAISRDALAAVPTDQREAALSLGATQWETTRVSVLPYARSGILGAITLALGRAVGETIAVTFVIGNSNHILGSLLAPGQSIASWIANQFQESTLPLEKSALLELGLVLLLMSLVINVGARLLIRRAPGFEGGAA